MKALVVGGGKVGYYLVKTLKSKGYKITLIERDKALCNKIAEELEVDVIYGDGTDIEVLRDAGIYDTEVVAAVTGKDEENFTICQIVKMKFCYCETIARINNPKNRQVFKALGIDKTVCSTEVIANLIESELNHNKIKVVQPLDKGEMILVEAVLDEKSKWKDKTISAIDAPEGCVIVSIYRNDKIIYPKGSIGLKEGDRIFIVVSMSNKCILEKIL